MKWLSKLSALIFGFLTLGMIKEYLDNNRILIINNNVDDIEIDIEDEEEALDIVDLKPENYDRAMDLRGTPTHICPCGCNIFNVKAIFDDYEIATYFIDMECVNCGSLATAPTPLDREETDL